MHRDSKQVRNDRRKMNGNLHRDQKIITENSRKWFRSPAGCVGKETEQEDNGGEEDA